jgi:integrase
LLSEVRIRSIKPSEKNQKLYDEKGLYLLVTRKGKKYWRFDYRFNGKRKTISFGVYPEVTLKEARHQRDEARRLLREGIDPSLRKKAGLSDSVTFRDIAEKWYQHKKPQWKEEHAKTIKYRLELYVLPAIGEKTLSEIQKQEILDLLKGIEISGKAETARRIGQIVRSIFDYAIALDYTDKNPASVAMKYLKPQKQKHHPALLDPVKIGKLLRDIENYKGDFVVKCALQVLAYTFVRPGELRLARWREFNLEEGVWDIPAERMKMQRPHRVFLAKQVIAILKKLQNVTGNTEYVFRGRGLKPLSDNTLNRALRIMGYDTRTEITAHGFRAMARTLIHEKLEYPPEVIEHQLAHSVPDPLGDTYNRTKFYKERRKMMQDWANYLDSLKNSLQAASD